MLFRSRGHSACYGIGRRESERAGCRRLAARTIGASRLMPRKPARTATFPSKDDILRFIAESPTPVSKREIGRAFALHGADKIALKSLLRSAEHTSELSH